MHFGFAATGPPYLPLGAHMQPVAYKTNLVDVPKGLVQSTGVSGFGAPVPRHTLAVEISVLLKSSPLNSRLVL